MKYACPRCGKPMIKNGYTPGGKQRWVCREGEAGRLACYVTTNPGLGVERKQDGSTKRRAKSPIFKRSLGGIKRFIVTAAQNATPVHKGFITALTTACNHLNAELLIIPLRYKNPTSRWTESQENAEVWANETQPYLFNARRALNKNLMLIGDVKVQPTAQQPLTGFEALTHGESCILGHTKLQLRTVATPQSQFPKILTTTGACTVANYTDSKAGALGAFHHTLGAAMVELEGKTFHLRQINANKQTGSFIDLNTQYGDVVSVADRPEALIMGDTHVDFIDSEVSKATFGAEGIVRKLQPRVLVWHDLLDAYSVNPHHLGNPFNAIAKIQNNRADVRAELDRACAFLERHTPFLANSVVIPSNHDNMLSRWIVATDWRQTPGNAEFYLETALAMVRGVKLDGSGTSYPDPFTYWARQKLDPKRFRFLDPDESFSLASVELGMHGDKGPNGSRGSIKNLRRMGVKSVIGHTHSPGIEEGCYQVGTSTKLKLEYTSGPSGWLNTHCIVYANGKRSLINIIKGEWRL